MQNLLNIENLSVDFATDEGQRRVVQEVNLNVERGEIVALVGESGSGKSITARSVMRLLPKSSHIAEGRLKLLGEDITRAPESRLLSLRGSRVGMVFQEPLTSLNPLHRVGRQVAESMIVHSRRGCGRPCPKSGSAEAQTRPRLRRRIREEVIELLGRVGLPDPRRCADAFPHQLSGGQRQRAMIALALANAPDLLIADEPTTALDVTIQLRILGLLDELRRDLNMGVLLISHDLGIVRRHADRVYVMKDGRIVEEGPTETLFTMPGNDYTKLLLGVDESKPPAPVSIDAPTLLKIDNLKVWFPVQRGILRRTVGHVKAVDGVSLEVRRGESLAVVGESGSGKTTLALAALRLIGSKGEIRLGDVPLSEMNSRSMRPHRPRMQVVFQDPFSALSPRMTVGDIVAEGLRVHTGLSRREISDRVAGTMREVGLDPEFISRYPHELSGGQRQRVAIARALVLEPELLVLDEPTSSLDRSIQFQVVDLLRRLRETRGLACLFITHDLSLVRRLCHRVIVMRDGKVVEAGDVESLFSAPSRHYTKELLDAADFSVSGTGKYPQRKTA